MLSSQLFWRYIDLYRFNTTPGQQVTLSIIRNGKARRSANTPGATPRGYWISNSIADRLAQRSARFQADREIAQRFNLSIWNDCFWMSPISGRICPSFDQILNNPALRAPRISALMYHPPWLPNWRQIHLLQCCLEDLRVRLANA